MTLQTQDVPSCAGVKLIGADGIKDDGFVSVAGTLAEKLGMYFSGPDLNFGGKYDTDFLPKYRALSGTKNPIAPYHAHGFDAANILMDAIAKVGVQDANGVLWVPKDALRQYVAALKDYPGLTGTLTCNQYGDCGSSFVSIAQLKGGKPASGSTPAVAPVYTSVFSTRPS